ncbi:hypothetical protein MJO28_005712 [Puccinia striiformis f. sp. tritici]|nr:hypothetical protein Pst134EB_010934 [Puccinia striiformis f. sp. tritici]KAI7955312.1 hypothetical protein MJO28_005712 [Puccinia striiformis f. sp. tritici]KAI9612119.1 hypothetical protein H4Q26_008211 [Puccinia striiformis f. sp. tritici PST-130]
MKNQTGSSKDSAPQTSTSSSSKPTPPLPKPTTIVRHRFPKRKINTVWKPLSSKSCDLIQESLYRSMKDPYSDYPSLRKIEHLTRKLTGKIRVPIGVYTELKTNENGQVDLLSLDGYKKRNSDLESLMLKHQLINKKLEIQNKNLKSS